ncbi:MAG: hypothetical protein GF398_13890 [Chitinivibrionales bacterium]|nr:hypothetical protein [Chitinivibrionales bacterium]
MPLLGPLLHLVEGSPAIAWAALVVAFVILAKSADSFVDSSVGLADRFNLPRLVIGIILVSLATTAPELNEQADYLTAPASSSIFSIIRRLYLRAYHRAVCSRRFSILTSAPESMSMRTAGT